MTRRVVALAFLIIGCSTRAPSRVVESPRERPGADAGRLIRVALGVTDPRVSATEEFGWYEGNGRTLLARGRPGEQWRMEPRGDDSRVRATRTDGSATSWQRALVARVNSGGFVSVNGRRYRGDLHVVPENASFVVVNRLPIEEYLRGVVPVELGRRSNSDSAALQAQAIAARSVAYARLSSDAARAFDVRGSVLDQAYGGAEVEYSASNAAIAATAGLVLRYQGRNVDAPYHSTCGGTTAEAPEVWRTPGAAYLQRVSDRIGSSDRYYCDSAPRYRWTRTLAASQLNPALEEYLKIYTAVPGGRPGAARNLSVRSRTESGRVAVLDAETDRGTFPIRGNDIRYVLRAPGDEILSSTYFSVEPELGGDGMLSRVTLRGRGHGHGVGMCQWGAIGRARAGQNFRFILGTYYPGTTIGPVQ